MDTPLSTFKVGEAMEGKPEKSTGVQLFYLAIILLASVPYMQQSGSSAYFPDKKRIYAGKEGKREKSQQHTAASCRFPYLLYKSSYGSVKHTAAQSIGYR